MNEELIKNAQFYYNNIIFDFSELKIHLKSIGIETNDKLSEKINSLSCQEIDNCVIELSPLIIKLSQINNAHAIIAKSLISRILLNANNIKLHIQKCDFP